MNCNNYMSTSFLVPFTLHVKPSDECDSVHDHLGPLLSLISREDHVQTRARTDGTLPPCRLPIPPCATVQVSDLLTPVCTQPVPNNESLTVGIQRFVGRVRHASACEKAHVRLVFKEYCQRKSVECEWEAELERLCSAELHPAACESFFALAAAEAAAREDLLASYARFVAWVEASTPAWLDEAQRLEASHCAQTEAIGAAQRALAAELGGSPSDESLRRQAIAMLEREQVERRRGQAEAIVELRAQEAQLRAEMAARAQRSAAEAEAQRANALDACARSVAETEAQLRSRLDARAAHRNEMLTHMDAEEEVLRVRIAERDRRREEAEAEAQRIDHQRQDELYEHVRAEEELLRDRIAERGRRRDETEAEAQRIEQQRQDELYEHLRAEEELLRDRIAERDRRREEAEAEAQRIEQQRQDELYEHLRAEEELLRDRIAERDRRQEEAEAEAQRIEQQRQDELYEHLRAEEDLLRDRIADRERRREADHYARHEEDIRRLQYERELLELRMQQQQQQGVSHGQRYGEVGASRHLQEQTRPMQYYDPMIAVPEVLPPPCQWQQVLVKHPQDWQPSQQSVARLGIQRIDHQQLQQHGLYQEEQRQLQGQPNHFNHYQHCYVQPCAIQPVTQPRHYTSQ